MPQPQRHRRHLRALILLALLGAARAADQAATPLGEPVVEPSTTRSIGLRWLVRGDADRHARIAVSYRRTDAKDWRDAQPLWRVEKGANKRAGKADNPSAIDCPDDAWIFAGSILFLEPATAYQVRLKLENPGGAAVEKLVAAATAAQPSLPATLRVRHVVPGDGGGDGSDGAPFKGLAAASVAAQPGDRFVLAAGVYRAPLEVATSGEPGKPIVFDGPASGEAVIDGAGVTRVVNASGRHDLWFRGLTIRGGEWGIVLHEAHDVVVSRCRFTGCHNGITATRNGDRALGRLYIADNALEGPFAWLLPFDGDAKADDQWHHEYRGIECSGTAVEICHNRVAHFKDAIDLAPSEACVDCDVHHNDVSQDIDDSIEMDGSERNDRCWLNRCTDSHTGISVQPVFGGPCYIVRNTIYSTHSEPLKMHNEPSGVVFVHNTCVKAGQPFGVSTPERIHATLLRDNLFLGTADRAFNLDAPEEGFDADFDGFGGFSGGVFMKFADVRYATPDEVRAKAPIERHLAIVDPATAFASGVVPPADAHPVHAHDLDLRLKPGSAAIDAGTPLANLDDGFSGAAPDLGAFELGAELPRYGPRPQGEGAGEARAGARPAGDAKR